MRKCIFALFALVISLFGTQCWAQETGCVTNEGGGITCTFNPTATTHTFDFSGTGDGKLVVSFVTVLTSFTLTATINHTIDAFDPNEFPVGTAAVTYCNGNQDQYDFTGSAGGPNGVPVKGTDYQGLINILLIYLTCSGENYTPAFAHAPGDITTFIEDILTFYSSAPFCSEEPPFTNSCDPTMDGDTPGLSSVVAAKESLIETDTFCFVSPTEGQTFSAAQVPVIEVTFQLSAGGSCPIAGQPIRDKTAHFSIAMTDSSGNFLSRPVLRDREEANKFHWDKKNGLNEFDLSTVGLAPGHYTITLRSTKFSVRSVDINITP